MFAVGALTEREAPERTSELAARRHPLPAATHTHAPMRQVVRASAADDNDEEVPHPLCFFVPISARSLLMQWWLAVQRETGFADVVTAANAADGPSQLQNHQSVSPLRMSVQLRKKLSRGAHYNLRLLVRGDLQTGKTQLWRRLQGLPFAPNLPASTELGVAHVDWSDGASADVVKVESKVRNPNRVGAHSAASSSGPGVEQ